MGKHGAPDMSCAAAVPAQKKEAAPNQMTTEKTRALSVATSTSLTFLISELLLFLETYFGEVLQPPENSSTYTQSRA